MIIVTYGSRSALDELIERLKEQCDCHAQVAGVVVRITHDQEVDSMVIDAVVSNLTEQLGQSVREYTSKEAAVEGAVRWIDEQIRILHERRSKLV